MATDDNKSDPKKPTVLGYEPGPYSRKFTKTVELAPIKFTITEDEQSSHVPPPEVIPPAPCGCKGAGGGGIDLMSLLAPYLVKFAQGMNNPGDPGAGGGGEPPPDGEHTH